MPVGMTSASPQAKLQYTLLSESGHCSWIKWPLSVVPQNGHVYYKKKVGMCMHALHVIDFVISVSISCQKRWLLVWIRTSWWLQQECEEQERKGWKRKSSKQNHYDQDSYWLKYMATRQRFWSFLNISMSKATICNFKREVHKQLKGCREQPKILVYN